MKSKNIIMIETEDGILHDLIVKSVNQDDRTVTGEITVYEPSIGAVVKTVTVPDHMIR